ncbi:unnamed protein product, partial [Prorocentrum cordatum]
MALEPAATAAGSPRGAEAPPPHGEQGLRNRRAERLCGALEAVASRARFQEQKRRRAAVVLQAFARGAAARRLAHAWRRRAAQAQLAAVWQRFRARRQLLEARGAAVARRDGELWRGALETALARLLLREMKDRTRAAVVIAARARGMLARKRMRLMLIHRRAFERLKPLRCIWSRRKAQALVLRLHEEQRGRSHREAWHAAVRTLKLRLLLDFKVINRRESSALAVIAGHISAMYDRRRPKVMQVIQHLNRLRVEQEDRRHNIQQRAVYRLQMMWRSWVQKQRELAGKLVDVLDGEWRDRKALTADEVPFLEHLGGGGALQAVHARVLRAGTLSAPGAPAVGWVERLAGLARDAADVRVGLDFAA